MICGLLMSFMVFPVYSELTIGIRMDPVGQRNAESIANSDGAKL
jgi:hypothetical protein